MEFNVLGAVDGYVIGNDSYYDTVKKQLYTTVFQVEGNTILKNAVVQYDLSNLQSGANYEAVRVILADIDPTKEKKFEIEGMCIVDGKKYICTNSWNLNEKIKTQILLVY